MRLRLSHKGLMLVSGVLLFELILVAIFAGLLGRSDQELDRRYVSVSVMSHVDNVRKLLTEAEVGFNQTDTRTSFDGTLSAIRYELSALRIFLKGDPDSLENLNYVDQAVNVELQRLSRARSLFLSGRAQDFDYRRFENSMTSVSYQLDQLTVPYRRPLEFVTDRATISRRLTESNVIFVVLINAIVAVATTLFFMQGIVNRLSVVADNSVRFGRGEELHPPIDGTDEIATLDKIFHETIKERKFVETLLRESEARTRSLIENMPVGVVTIDQDGVIESINPETEKMFGYLFDEVVGDHLTALFSSLTQSDQKSFTENVLLRNLGKTLKFESRRKSGEPFPVEMTLTEYQSVDGPRYLAIIQDITEREKAEQFKQELLQMVSHDLRSPLTSVQGVMTLLAKGMYGQLTETGDKRVRVAEQSLVRLIHLVDDILDLERMEAGKLQFNLDRVPLSSVIDRSIESVYDFAQASHIKIEATPTEVEVDADEDRLTQVIVNLLSNAIKFSPKNSVIKVDTEEGRDFTEVRVHDHGPGVPSEQQESIFMRFHQVDSISSSVKGTGLGLAISKAIIEGHEGAIGVRSEPGKGSSFWFRIPRAVVSKGEPVPERIETLSAPKLALP
jgi:PAS domain S-box-containing protein